MQSIMWVGCELNRFGGLEIEDLLDLEMRFRSSVFRCKGKNKALFFAKKNPTEDDLGRGEREPKTIHVMSWTLIHTFCFS